MNSRIFQVGQLLPEYAIPVLNERAVRAAAGLLFLFAMMSFMNAWLTGNFQPTRLFVVIFLVNFSLRIFVNPIYSPSLILGQWVVRKQRPDYVGAPQKRFAWAIGFLLALSMFYLVVLNNVVGPINMLVCSLCLILLFFEAAFGICIGCKAYNLLNKEKAQLCPGGACELPSSEYANISAAQLIILVLSVAVVFFASQWVNSTGRAPLTSARQVDAPEAKAPLDPTEAARCQVPEFAKAIGHEAQWKLHNHCN